MISLRRSLLVAALSPLAGAATKAGASPPAPMRDALVVATDGRQPCVAVGTNGAVYVVVVQAGNVAVAVSTDRGATFSAPRVAIDAKGRARAGMQRGPRIGVDAKGRLAVTAPLTYDDAEAKRKYPRPEIYLATSSDGGATWSTPARVNEVEKKAPEGLHAMRVAPDGTVHVAWLDLRASEHGQDLWYARVVDGKVGANVRMAEGVCECCAPGLALDGRGNPVLAWRDGKNEPSREVFAVRSKDGGATFEAPRRINREETKEISCPMSAPAVALSVDGSRFAAAWKDVREGPPRVWWWFTGEPEFPAETAIAAGSPSRNHPSLAAIDGGAFWAAWEEERGPVSLVCARTSSSDGVVEVAEMKDGAAGFPVVSAADGLVVVAWEERPKGGTPRAVVRVLSDRGR